jgi:hypothetical protein
VKLWAVEQLLENMLVIDAYILLKSLGTHDDQFSVIGSDVRTLRTLIDQYNLMGEKLDNCTQRVCFQGGPHMMDWYVTSLKHYITDRVLQAIILLGPAKVANVFEEILSLT